MNICLTRNAVLGGLGHRMKYETNRTQKSSLYIENFLNFLRNCESEYGMAQADEKESNDETQDILHSLELEKHEYKEYAKLGKELKAIRQYRRKAKDTIELTWPIVEWIEQHKSEIKSLENLLGVVRKAEKKMDNRIYIPKSKRKQQKIEGVK